MGLSIHHMSLLSSKLLSEELTLGPSSLHEDPDNNPNDLFPPPPTPIKFAVSSLATIHGGS
jgi:hypothetical protein